MGNLCGKQSNESDPFSQPGRTVGSALPQPPNPRSNVPKISSQGQTLGGGSGSGSGSGIKDQQDARSAAAKAAEERAAKASQPKGKLGRDLASQKAQTRNGTLVDMSNDERRRRDADTTAETRNYN